MKGEGEVIDTIERIFLRVSFPLSDNRGHVASTFFLDSGTPGSHLLLSARVRLDMRRVKGKGEG